MGLERNPNMMFTSDLHIFDDNMSLPEQMKDVCVLSIPGDTELTVTGWLCWGLVWII